MSFGKTIEMYLVDGTGDGLVTAELYNWNGKAIKVPRTDIASYDRDDITGVGIYFLFGKDSKGSDCVYIGESENILERLKQHITAYNRGKEDLYWVSAVCFTGRDLDKALIRYLENRLVTMAKEAGRYKVTTEKTYNSKINEAKLAAMEEFLENVKVLLSALGFRVLIPTEQSTDQVTVLHCTGNNANANGYVSPGGFTVKAGSLISDHDVPSLETRAPTYFKLRKRLTSDGTIVDGVFQQDYEFTAPSAASAVVLGRPSSGNHDWKTQDGKKLSELSV